MTVNIVINGCARDFERISGQLNGFLQQSGLDTENIKEGNTIIICGREQDGDDRKRLAEMAPTSSVIFILMDYYSPEPVLDFLAERADEEAIYLFGSTPSGVELAVRLGARLGGSSLTGACRLYQSGDELLAEKMVYSNHMKGTFAMEGYPCCVSIAKGQEECANVYAGEHRYTEHDLREQQAEDETPEFEFPEEANGLEDADFLVVAGRGAGNKEKLLCLKQSAEKMQAAFGITRPAAMNAWASMDKLVGVSGAMVRPKVCIAAGISGAPALYAGIEKSQFIVAINTDERAPMLKKADVAVIGDCREILEALSDRIGGDRENA